MSNSPTLLIPGGRLLFPYFFWHFWALHWPDMTVSHRRHINAINAINTQLALGKQRFMGVLLNHTSKSSENPCWLLEYSSLMCLTNCLTGIASISSVERKRYIQLPFVSYIKLHERKYLHSIPLIRSEFPGAELGQYAAVWNPDESDQFWSKLLVLYF